MCNDLSYGDLGHSGLDTELKTSGTFCNTHGSRMRCPKLQPSMCANTDCANGQDYCCSMDCIPHGGQRACDTVSQVPAQKPDIIQAMSLVPAGLSLQWTAVEYLLKRSSSCVFYRWIVEIARVFPSGRE